MTTHDLATTSTEWPSTPVPQSVKTLLDNFFILMDNNTADAGARISDEIFTPSATFMLSGGTYIGSAG